MAIFTKINLIYEVSRETDSSDRDSPSSPAIPVLGVEDVVSSQHMVEGVAFTQYMVRTSAKGCGASIVVTSASETDNLLPVVTETWEKDEESQHFLYQYTWFNNTI